MVMKTGGGRSWFGPLARGAAMAVAGVIALAGCANETYAADAVAVEGTAGPAGLGTSAGAGPGCPAGGAAVPKDSNRVATDDLDDDGEADELWLAHDQGLRLLGVSTASGASFSMVLNQWDAGALEQRVGDRVNALAGRLGDGSAVILLDLGRSAALYSVVNCYIVATTNAEGHPYLFDLGYDMTGDGVGCLGDGSERILVGYRAEYDPDQQTYKVSRRAVELDKDGKRATNGPDVLIGKDLAERADEVRRAQSIACGENSKVAEPPFR
ncbi:hypothetical protein LWF15_32870 [Kineosporia rhizophila]|uniref:hypothetical protein n=1 Tax=Kineosporia TaxID=49184 RepID=UPI001E48F9B6|nr:MULTISPECIES: hypothetical protein [Kineosporia]MCE0540299.1 hypothetical protein [Kineosporia rhizophila]